MEDNLFRLISEKLKVILYTFAYREDVVVGAGTIGWFCVRDASEQHVFRGLTIFRCTLV